MVSPNEETGRSEDEQQYLVALGQCEVPQRLIKAPVQMIMALLAYCFNRQF